MKLDKIIFTKDDDTEIILTKDEASKLYQELHSLFGATLSYIPYTPAITQSDWRWPYPIWGGGTSCLTGKSTELAG